MSNLSRTKWAVLITCAASLMVLVFFAYSYTFLTTKEPEEFKGIKWGTSIRDLPDLTFLAEEGDVKFYAREADELKIGNVDVERIIYGFYSGQFYNVVVYYSTLTNRDRLIDFYSKAYGQPNHPEGTSDKYLWEANSVNLLLTYDEPSNHGRVSYVFQPVDAQIQADEKAAGEKP